MSDIRYWVGLSIVPEVGPVISRKLLSEMGSPENIFRAGLKDLQAMKGLSREKAGNIRNFSLWDSFEKIVKMTEKSGTKVVRYQDPSYPEVLKEVDGAPIGADR